MPEIAAGQTYTRNGRTARVIETTFGYRADTVTYEVTGRSDKPVRFVTTLTEFLYSWVR